MNNTPFYYYLQSIMRQATKLTMNALLCDCQLFYKILNRFIYSIIMCIIKLLLFNKLISPVSPEPYFEIWLKASTELILRSGFERRCLASPAAGGLLRVAAAQGLHCLGKEWLLIATKSRPCRARLSDSSGLSGALLATHPRSFTATLQPALN